MKNWKKKNSLSIVLTTIFCCAIIAVIFTLSIKDTNSIFNISNESGTYESSIGTIKFEKDSYFCEEGETFDTLIKTYATKSPATVSSYSSSNPKIASIDEVNDYKVKCLDCKMVRVSCKKSGSVVLSAESSTGAKTSVDLVVNLKDGAIVFSEDFYTCNAKETFETMIKTTVGNTIASYKSENEDIAVMDDKVSTQVRCVNCKVVRVVCKKEGVTALRATSSNGSTTRANLTVKEDIGTISFSQNSYSCNAGDVIETMIKTSGVLSYVESFASNDSNIATIDDNSNLQLDCVNCKRVRIVCLSQGVTTLSATSTTGAMTSVSVSVNKGVGSIYYEKPSYTCSSGEVFETKITAKGGTIRSFASSDTSIAIVDDKASTQYKCPDCKMVRVTCIKKGSVTLYATSSSGARTTSSLEVKDNIGTISYEKSSYSCNAGEKFETLITANGGPVGTYVKSYSSSDTTIATIDDKTTTQLRCINCKMVRVVCKKKGNVSLRATSSSGAKTSVSLSVNASVGSISFEKPSYTCSAGSAFETVLTVTGGPTDSVGSIHVKSISTSNRNIATIDENVTSHVNCVNCKVVRVVCKKEGSVILSATSTKGATTTASLNVTKDIGTISFTKNNYSCKAGKTIETVITAYGPGGTPAVVSSYYTSNANIASIDEVGVNPLKCPNCKAVRIVCKKKGTVVLNAKSSTGAKGTANLIVSNN